MAVKKKSKELAGAEDLAIKVRGDYVEIARKYKEATDVPIKAFIERGIEKEIAAIPADIKSKMGIK